MRGIRTSRDIAVHFVWTLLIAMIVCKIGTPLFHLIILFNAGFAGAVALVRRDSPATRKITLWDEAAALIGVSALARLLH